MNLHDQTYLNALRHVLGGKLRTDRTGTGAYSKFGMQMRFDLLNNGFPLLTSKSCHFKSIAHELLWFLKGETNIQYLKDNKVKIWDEWATKEGELGPVYGAMWRSWPSYDFAGGEHARLAYIDQIAKLIDGLKARPFSRRQIVSAWNPALLPDEDLSAQENVELGNQALPPCHTLFQFYVEELTIEQRWAVYKRPPVKPMMPAQYRTPEQESDLLDGLGVPRLGLSCQLYQRSADMFLGVPFNIASYALLTLMVAQVVGMAPLEFVWTGGDCHVYTNHIEQVREQLARQDAGLIPESPQVYIEGEFQDIEDITFDDIKLMGYKPLPAIKAPVAV